MQVLKRLVFRLLMLATTAAFIFLAYWAYSEQKPPLIVYACGLFAVVGRFHFLRGPKEKGAANRGRRKALVRFANLTDAQMELYEKAQATSSLDGAPTKAQQKFASCIGVVLPEHVRSGTAMEIIDDAIEF
jgi:hypothetical protein